MCIETRNLSLGLVNLNKIGGYMDLDKCFAEMSIEDVLYHIDIAVVHLRARARGEDIKKRSERTTETQVGNGVTINLINERPWAPADEALYPLPTKGIVAIISVAAKNLEGRME
jgi:hypothetical protein